MDFGSLAHHRLQQLDVPAFVSPWDYARKAGLGVLFRRERVLRRVTAQDVIVVDVTQPLRACGAACFMGLAEIELRRRGHSVHADDVEQLACALALPERSCMALFDETGCFEGDALERAQPYADERWIASRLETLWQSRAGQHLRLVRSGDRRR